VFTVRRERRLYVSLRRNSESINRVMAQVVSSRLVIAEAWVQNQVSLCEICGGQRGTATGFSPSTSFIPHQYHSTNAPHSSSTTRCSYQKVKRTVPGNLPKSCSVSIIGETLTGEVLRHCLAFRVFLHKPVCTCTAFTWLLIRCGTQTLKSLCKM
jgi:hypothetical protein